LCGRIRHLPAKPQGSGWLENKNFFELLDLICIRAGPDYFWSATKGVVVLERDQGGTAPIDPFKKPKPNQPEQVNPITRP